jgi:hypothetical protein
MGCGCIVALLAMISPRFAYFIVWAFTDRTAIAFDSFWVGLLGFLFLPWTALAWALLYAPVRGVTGFGWFLVILAFLVDITTLTGGARARRRSDAQR